MNCWEKMWCSAEVRGKCRAYPDHGKDCWKVTGTMCGGGAIKAKTITEKINYCRGCDYYREYASKD